MSCTSLQSILARVERAKAHSDTINHYITDAFQREEDCPAIGFKFDPQTHEGVLYVSQMPLPPDFTTNIALWFGEAVHNLRSALDHVVYHLAILKTNHNIKRPDRTQFPICDCPDRFQRETKQYLGEVKLSHVARIQRLQPYPRRREPTRSLAILRDLNNIDKHRLLLPAITVPHGMTINMTHKGIFEIAAKLQLGSGRKGRSSWSILRKIELNPGAEIIRTRLEWIDGPGYDMEVTGRFRPKVTLGDGVSVGVLLPRLISATEAAIGRFTPPIQ